VVEITDVTRRLLVPIIRVSEELPVPSQAKRNLSPLCLLAISALTATLGSLTDTLSITGGFAYVNYVESG
jgi:hypothetical protein